MSLFTELNRRNVIRLGAAYIVIGWLAIEVATTLMPIFGAPEWVTKVLLFVIGLGFIPVVVFAWVYELTPEGLKRESEVDRDESITRHTGKKLNYITIGAVVFLIAVFGWSRLDQSTTRQTTIPADATILDASVAVLPFVNMSGNQENEYFSDGLTETLLHMLAQVPELKVAARTSSFAFKGQKQDIREIASALDVAHVLEGSVQRAGNKVRITVQLIRASDGFHVWSENYDRTLDDIFGIQDEIAQKVGGALSASLLGAKVEEIEGVSTHNVAAYDLYLQALSETASFSYGGLEKAEGLLKDAISLDTGFLEAKEQLAFTYMQQGNTGLIPQSEAWTKGEALLVQVLAERPDSIEARATMLWLTTQRDINTGNLRAGVEALPKFKALVEEAPNSINAIISYAQSLKFLGTVAEFEDQYQTAIELDPLNPEVYYLLGEAYESRDEYEKGLMALRRSLELNPNQPNAESAIADILRKQGDAVGFIKHFMKASQIDKKDHELPAAIARYLYMQGLPEEGDRFREKTVAVAPTSEVARTLDLLRAKSAGDRDAVLSLASQMIIDDVDNRHGSYLYACFYYLAIRTARGEAQEAIDFMAEHAPGFANMGSAEVPLKLRFVQGGSYGTWAAVLSDEELSHKWEARFELTRSMGFDPEENKETWLDYLASTGRTEEAVEFALEYLETKSAASMAYWEDYLMRPVLADVIADPGMQDELRRLTREREELRQQIRTFLADQEI